MQTITVVVETPKGSNIKYKFDPEKQVFKVKKSLPLGMVFPYAFGFVPGTKGADGDPLDAMLFSTEKYFTGCHVESRLIGALLAEQSEKGKKMRNDRYFFVPEDDITFQRIKSFRDFGKQHNQQLIDFFINYNRAEGKTFRPLRTISRENAIILLKK